MRKVIIVAVAVLMTANVWAQAPEKMSYQSVVRDQAGLLLSNAPVGVMVRVLEGSSTGVVVFEEEFNVNTNTNGLLTLSIGTGVLVSGDFTTIDWGNDSYFAEVSTDVTGGTNYTLVNISELMSVPYALHAKTAENVTNDLVDDADADPNNEIQAVSLSNDTLYLSNGGQVYLGTYGIDLVDDADADAMN